MRFPFLLFFFFLFLSELALTSLALFDYNNNNNNNDLSDTEIASFLESTLKSVPVGSLNTPSTFSSSIFFEWPHPSDRRGGSSSAPAMLVSSERIGWEMAATAGRKHAEIFYSSWSPSWSSSQVTGVGNSAGKAPTEPTKPDPTRYRRSFYPLNYLHNHLVNTGYSIFEAVWHLAAVAKPHIIGLYSDTPKMKGGSLPSSSATTSRGSITSTLTCLPFGTRPHENVSCPLPPQGGTLRGRFPESTQAVGVWELVKEAVVIGYHTCSSSSSPRSAVSHSNPSSPSMFACTVGRASEVLYWSMRADDYAVGKGRIAQFSVLLDIVQEEVGGEAASYWSAGVPSAVGLGLKGAFVYRYTSKRAPPPHPQFVSFSGNGRDGHEVLPPLPAVAPTKAQKAVVQSKKGPAAVLTDEKCVAQSARGLFPLNSYTYYESRINVSGSPCFITVDAIKEWKAMTDKDLDHDQGEQAKAHDQSSSNRPGDTTVRQKSVISELMSSRGISKWNITEIPLASSREGGREILKGYYDTLRGLLSAKRLEDSFRRDETTPRAEYCAPLPASLPFCSFSEELSTAGNEKYLEFLAGPENRERQIPIRLENSLEASVKTDTGKVGGPNKKGDAPAPSWRRQALPIQVDTHGDKDASNPQQSPPSSPAEMLTYLRRARRQHFFSRMLTTPTALDADRSDANTHDTPAPLVFKGDAEDIYSPFIDPRSPLYRRVLCATYSYHKNNARAAAFHVTGARHCDKHLLFTDKPMPPEILAKLNEDRFVVVALNTPGGEAYGNMWQKTRMILDTLELLVRGYEDRTPEEGANDPELSTRRPEDIVPTSPRRFGISSSLRIVHKEREGGEKGEVRAGPPQLVATVSSSGLGVREVATALLPHYSGYDYVLLSGDDVCLNAPKMRRYLAEVDELFSVPLPASTTTHSTSSSCSTCPHYRSATTPHHIGYSHKRFISGAAYLMNRQGYNNHMASGHSTCLATKRTFAEDVMMGTCHRASGVMYRHTGSYGLLEDVFNSVSIEYVTGTVHTVRHTNWLTAFRRTVWPRNGAVTSKDSIVHHFCSVPSMQNFEQDLMSAVSTV